MVNDERKLMEAYIEAREKKDDLESKLKDAEKVLDAATDQLISFLDSIEATKTSFYPGLGHITIAKPRVQARIEDDQALFEALRSEAFDRGDIIKETVHTGTLGTLLKELLENFKPIPAGSTYYLKRTPSFYKDKKTKQ